jgi:hypothetical protein
VARHFHPAPFAHHSSPLVEDERAALDAADLSPVQVLVLHDAEGVARLLIRVGKELERKLVLGLEAFVRLEGIARDAVDVDPGTPELLVELTEVAALRGAAGRVVLGVEVEDQPLAALV